MNCTGTAISGFAFDNKQFFTVISYPIFLHVCNSCVLRVILVSAFNAMYGLSIFSWVHDCVTVLVHFDPKLELVPFQFDT